MNYKRIYNEIIQNRKSNPLDESEYGEWHHIIPKSLGGIDDSDNLVRLSAREHFICHLLLSEIYDKGSNEWYKMNLAFKMMICSSESHNNNRYFNSRLYEYKRKDFSKLMSNTQSGKRNSQYGTMWIHNEVSKANRKIKKDEPIPDGWVIGRNRHRKTKKEKEQERVNKFIKKSNKLFDKFMESDCTSVSEWARSGEVTHSQQYLSKLWLEYIPHRYKQIVKHKLLKVQRHKRV